MAGARKAGRAKLANGEKAEAMIRKFGPLADARCWIAVAAWLMLTCWEPCLARNGDELLAQCLSGPDNPKSFYCLGYVSGVVETPSDIICLPQQGIEGGQLRDVVVKYLEAHPEMRRLPAAMLVQVALASAFPCKARR